MVEHSTADREVPGSNPGVPFYFRHMQVIILLQIVKGYISASMTCSLRSPRFKSGCPLLFYSHASDNNTTDGEGLYIRFDDLK